MRLKKRGRRYSIIVDEAGTQTCISTGLTNLKAAKHELTKMRRARRRQQQGLSPWQENPRLRLLPAIRSFLRRTKRQLSLKQRRSLRRRLLTICYEILRQRHVKKRLRRIHFSRTIKPYLRGKRVLDLVCPLVERWIAVQVVRGRSILGHKGSHYKTIQDKVRLLCALTDYWYRRRKVLPEDPLARLDMPPACELPKSNAARKVRRPFEVDEAVEFFHASEFLDDRRITHKTPLGIPVPITPIFKTLLAIGSRPRELLGAAIFDVQLGDEPYLFIPANRCKTRLKGERKATMHPTLAAELAAYKVKYRSAATAADRFFVGPEGASLDTERLLDHFHRAAYLAFVRLEARLCKAQLSDTEADDVAFYLQKKKVRSVGGCRLTAATLAVRTTHQERILAIADLLAIPVARRIKHMDTYAFRHSHATWASDRGVPEVCIAKQLGHKVRGITGRYLSLESRKLIDSKRCSHAVWEMLMGAQSTSTVQ